MPGAVRGGRNALLPARIAIAAALIGAAGSLWLLVRETATLAAEYRLTESDIGPGMTPPPMPGTYAVPRARLADAALRARLASELPQGAARTRLLDQAIAELETIERARPFWGEAWVTAAFAQAMRDGDAAQGTVAAFRQSYIDAPYLDRSARWRIRYGLAQWRLLDAATRARVLDEAVWLARADQESLDWVTPLIRRSDAYRAFQLRWVETRRRDPNFLFR